MQFEIPLDFSDKPKRKVPSRFASMMRKSDKEEPAKVENTEASAHSVTKEGTRQSC